MENEVQQQPMQENLVSTSPSKHSNRKLLAILIVGLILGIVGGIIYIAKTTTVNKTSVTSNEESMKMAATPTMMPRSLVVTLNEQNNSSESGIATITEMGSQLKITIALKGTVAGSNQPAHIHAGYCPDNVGAVKYPLTNVVNGKSETMITATLDSLKKDLPLAINIHKSDKEMIAYTACGDLFGE